MLLYTGYTHTYKTRTYTQGAHTDSACSFKRAMLIYSGRAQTHRVCAYAQGHAHAHGVCPYTQGMLTHTHTPDDIARPHTVLHTDSKGWDLLARSDELC